MEYHVLIYFNWPVRFWNVPATHVEKLRARFPRTAFTHALTEDEAVAAAASADVLFTARCPAVIVTNAARLRWVQSSASSVSTLPLTTFASKSIVVTNTRSIQGGPIAEHVI